jgi:hypothetical protein
VRRETSGSRREEEKRSWKKFYNECFMILYRFSNIINGAEINENEISKACSRNKKYEKLIQRFVWKR